ncbi:hypothetical protein K523DRAFT_325676 [Schizophyllum commune Tattone D]|nr:hypothetical protein K523DRAFT_325676 [Schizophyllum commune Tattone D]
MVVDEQQATAHKRRSEWCLCAYRLQVDDLRAHTRPPCLCDARTVDTVGRRHHSPRYQSPRWYLVRR